MIEWIRELLAALFLAAAALAPQSAPAPEAPPTPPLVAPDVRYEAPPPSARATNSTSVAVLRGCALYAGPQLRDSVVLAELRRHDWAPFSAETMLELFRRESNLYLAAENLCTDDHGIPQINRPYHGAWCDVVRVKADLGYAIRCAARIYGEQGITAWIAAKGWLWW